MRTMFTSCRQMKCLALQDLEVEEDKQMQAALKFGL